MVRKFEADTNQLNFKLEQEIREKKSESERAKSMDELMQQNWEKINVLSEKLQKVENEKSKLEARVSEVTQLIIFQMLKKNTCSQCLF